MRLKSVPAVPALHAGLVAGEANPRSPDDPAAGGERRIALTLFVAAGLVGAAAGASLALLPSDGPTAAETQNAAAVHRPDRPSPVRPQIPAEAIAALFPPEAG